MLEMAVGMNYLFLVTRRNSRFTVPISGWRLFVCTALDSNLLVAIGESGSWYEVMLLFQLSFILKSGSWDLYFYLASAGRLEIYYFSRKLKGTGQAGLEKRKK